MKWMVGILMLSVVMSACQITHFKAEAGAVDGSPSIESFEQMVTRALPPRAAPASSSDDAANLTSIESFDRMVKRALKDVPDRTPLSWPTKGEAEELSRMISRCWKVPAFAQDVEDPVVGLRLEIASNGKIVRVSAVDNPRYRGDLRFRELAESAESALMRCSPLELPRENDDQWSAMTIFFSAN